MLKKILQKLGGSYHPQLIDIMLQASYGAAFSVNVLTPVFLSALLFNDININYIIGWLVLNLMICTGRFFVTYKAKIANKIPNKNMKPYLYAIYLIIFLSSILHSYALFYIIGHTSEMKVLFVAMVTITMVSGSITTLASLFTAFVIYVFMNLIPIVLIFIYTGGEIFYTFALAIFVYFFIMLINGYHIYQSLEENIRLKESFEARVQSSVNELKEKQQLLYEQSRLAQMGEMISMIAHQWRQPLNAISATSATMQLKAKLNKLDKDFVIEMTGKISMFSQHLSETINDFRNFFKPNKKKDLVDYTSIVESVLSIINISLENHNIRIEKELLCEKEFRTHLNELKQVILNLIKNAEDILIDNEVENPYIKISTHEENGKYILEVRDNGGGIPENIKKDIFNPYFSTKKQKEGTGLGLYMSKMIIEEHCKGELCVYNSEDGAVFVITVSNLSSANESDI